MATTKVSSLEARKKFLEMDLSNKYKEVEELQEKKRELLEDYNQNVKDSDKLNRDLKENQVTSKITDEVHKKKYEDLVYDFGIYRREMESRDMIIEDYMSLIVREQGKIKKQRNTIGELKRTINEYIEQNKDSVNIIEGLKNAKISLEA